MKGDRRVIVFMTMLLLGAGVGLFPRFLMGADRQHVKELVQNTCASCHRLEGPPASRLEKKAPDLIGSGSKFKHEWLVGWLSGTEAPIYALSYRWDQSRASDRHMVVSQAEAEAIAEGIDAV